MPRGIPGSLPTLAELEAKHASAETNRKYRDVLRSQARKLAAEKGVPVPAWCAKQPRTPKPPREPRAPKAPLEPMPAAPPPTIAADLSEWRAEGGGSRALVIRHDFIVLVRWDFDGRWESPRYPDLEAALAAINTDSIAWAKPMQWPKARFGGRRRACA